MDFVQWGIIGCGNVTAVYIATPPSSLCELALQVAAAGKPCLIEKPMAMTHAGCVRLRGRARPTTGCASKSGTGNSFDSRTARSAGFCRRPLTSLLHSPANVQFLALGRLRRD